MSFDHKITDLKYRINGLVPKITCKKIINIFEKYPEFHFIENSYKYETQKNEMDNYACLNLSKIKNQNKKILNAIKKPKSYIKIMLLIMYYTLEIVKYALFLIIIYFHHQVI